MTSFVDAAIRAWLWIVFAVILALAWVVCTGAALVAVTFERVKGTPTPDRLKNTPARGA